tara:strand:+ start:348 stop:692 length:345 start_codon:yes stop_codon:yes gene_type:complete
MALMDITIDTSLHTHADTLFMSGTKIAKLVYYAVDYNSTNTSLGLIDSPYTQQCYLSSNADKGFTGSLVGNLGSTGGSTAAMCPVFISADIGLRVFSSADSGSLIVVTYIEVTS